MVGTLQLLVTGVTVKCLMAHDCTGGRGARVGEGAHVEEEAGECVRDHCERAQHLWEGVMRVWGGG